MYMLDQHSCDEKERWSISDSWVFYSNSWPELGSGEREGGT